MIYRVELERIENTKHYFKSIHENVESSAGVKDYLKNCIEDGYKVSKIVKIYNDGRGVDITSKYIK